MMHLWDKEKQQLNGEWWVWSYQTRRLPTVGVFLSRGEEIGCVCIFIGPPAWQSLWRFLVTFLYVLEMHAKMHRANHKCLSFKGVGSDVWLPWTDLLEVYKVHPYLYSSYHLYSYNIKHHNLICKIHQDDTTWFLIYWSKRSCWMKLKMVFAEKFLSVYHTVAYLGCETDSPGD